MRPQEKPKSRLAANAPPCARCRKPMKVRILFPGRKVNDVTYKCEECGGEEMRSVPRAMVTSSDVAREGHQDHRLGLRQIAFPM
jgi:hypothetical protein